MTNTEWSRGTVDADLDPASVASQVLAMSDGLQLQWLLDPEGLDMVAVFEAFLNRLRPR